MKRITLEAPPSGTHEGGLMKKDIRGYSCFIASLVETAMREHRVTCDVHLGMC